MIPSGHDPSFQLHCAPVVGNSIRKLQRKASREGRGPEFLSALQSISQQLMEAADVFGEPVYRLPALRMQIRCAVVRPLAIDFAVCEDRAVVFLRGVQLLD